jgi:phosphoribosyl 1,2-cyclic phosphate phosphodiesterase
MKVTFLGTGTSHGVPSLDCMLGNFGPCPKGVCLRSLTDAKHARTRSSLLVECAGKRVLVDVSPDFRQQALREKIPSLDAVLITHSHADHIGGVPDIRSYTARRAEPLPFYGSGESMAAIRAFFPYIFDPDAFVGGGIPRISTNAIDAGFELFGLRISPFAVEHAGLKGCFGYRVNDMAYFPDVKFLPREARAGLSGLDLLVLNCLRETREHGSHLTLGQSMALARELRPRQCRFIHMSHDIDYETDGPKLDSWMAFAYDGLTIEI